MGEPMRDAYRVELAPTVDVHSRRRLIGQTMRYGVAGGLVALVYVAVTSVGSQLLRLPFQLALASGFGTALLLHFTLQRGFVWVPHSGYALRLHRQLGRYLAMAGAQYATTAASIAVLPDALGASTEIVYLATTALITVAGFLTMRFLIFHDRRSEISCRIAQLRSSEPERRP
jgi:putative flippase GtrA